MINDLPVGQTLMDHILTGLDLIMLNASLGLNLSDVSNPMSALNYFLFGRGKNMLIQIYTNAVYINAHNHASCTGCSVFALLLDCQVTSSYSS